MLHNVDKPQKYYDKWKKLDEKGHNLYEISKIGKFICTEIRLVVNRGIWRGDNSDWWINRYGVSHFIYLF